MYQNHTTAPSAMYPRRPGAWRPAASGNHAPAGGSQLVATETRGINSHIGLYQTYVYETSASHLEHTKHGRNGSSCFDYQIQRAANDVKSTKHLHSLHFSEQIPEWGTEAPGLPQETCSEVKSRSSKDVWRACGRIAKYTGAFRSAPRAEGGAGTSRAGPSVSRDGGRPFSFE